MATLTLATVKTMADEPHLIELANTLFLAMAYEQTIRPIVEGYQREILKRHQWTNKGCFERLDEAIASRGEVYPRDLIEVKVILEPSQSYNLGEEDFKVYLEEMDEAMIKVRLSVEEKGQCPLLVAENLTIKAQWAFVDALEQYTGIAKDSLFCNGDGIKTYEKYIDLNLQLFSDKVKGLAA